MIAGVTNNSLIAAIFGSTAVRRAHRSHPVETGRSADKINPLTPPAYPDQVDSVELSDVGRRAARAAAQPSSGAASPQVAGYRNVEREPPSTQQPREGTDRPTAPAPEEEAQVEKLRETDREVRRHEQAHQAAGGDLVRGGASYEFRTGPDGRQYAVGGEVQIDTSSVPGDPQATIAKMQRVRRAALAPANPSSQDRAVAAGARAQENQARKELAELRRSQRQERGSGGTGSPIDSATMGAATMAPGHTNGGFAPAASSSKDVRFSTSGVGALSTAGRLDLTI